MTRGMGQGRVMSASSLAQVRARLRAVFREAVADGLIAVNPTEVVRRVRVSRTEHPGTSLDFDEAALLHVVVRSCRVLPRISPHDLRHTAGTLMLRRGVPIEIVSKTLGHRDIAITYRVHWHVLESERRQRMVDLFGVSRRSGPRRGRCW